jgi:hypothetical protein
MAILDVVSKVIQFELNQRSSIKRSFIKVDNLVKVAELIFRLSSISRLNKYTRTIYVNFF